MVQLPAFRFMDEYSQGIDTRIRVSTTHQLVDKEIKKTFIPSITNTLPFDKPLPHCSGLFNMQYSSKYGICFMNCRFGVLSIPFHEFQSIFLGKGNIESLFANVSNTTKIDLRKKAILDSASNKQIHLSPDQSTLAIIGSKTIKLIPIGVVFPTTFQQQLTVPHQNWLFLSPTYLVGWDFKSKAYLFYKQSNSNRLIEKCIAQDCTSITHLSNCLFIGKTIQLQIFDYKSQKILNKISLNTEDPPDPIYPYCTVLSIFKINVHKSTKREDYLKALNSPFTNEDCYAMVTAYYNEGEDEEPSRRYLFFFKGDVMKSIQIQERSQYFDIRNDNQQEYWSNKKQRGFAVKYVYLGYSICVCIERSAEVFVINTLNKFTKMSLMILNEKSWFKESKRKLFVGLCGMKNMIGIERKQVEDSNEEINFICKKYGGEFIELYFDQIKGIVDFPSCLLALSEDCFYRKYTVSTVESIMKYEVSEIIAEVQKRKSSLYLTKIEPLLQDFSKQQSNLYIANKQSPTVIEQKTNLTQNKVSSQQKNNSFPIKLFQQDKSTKNNEANQKNKSFDKEQKRSIFSINFGAKKQFQQNNFLLKQKEKQIKNKISLEQQNLSINKKAIQRKDLSKQSDKSIKVQPKSTQTLQNQNRQLSSKDQKHISVCINQLRNLKRQMQVYLQQSHSQDWFTMQNAKALLAKPSPSLQFQLMGMELKKFCSKLNFYAIQKKMISTINTFPVPQRILSCESIIHKFIFYLGTLEVRKNTSNPYAKIGQGNNAAENLARIIKTNQSRLQQITNRYSKLQKEVEKVASKIMLQNSLKTITKQLNKTNSKVYSFNEEDEEEQPCRYLEFAKECIKANIYSCQTLSVSDRRKNILKKECGYRTQTKEMKPLYKIKDYQFGGAKETFLSKIPPQKVKIPSLEKEKKTSIFKQAFSDQEQEVINKNNLETPEFYRMHSKPNEKLNDKKYNMIVTNKSIEQANQIAQKVIKNQKQVQKINEEEENLKDQTKKQEQNSMLHSITTKIITPMFNNKKAEEIKVVQNKIKQQETQKLSNKQINSNIIKKQQKINKQEQNKIINALNKDQSKAPKSLFGDTKTNLFGNSITFVPPNDKFKPTQNNFLFSKPTQSSIKVEEIKKEKKVQQSIPPKNTLFSASNSNTFLNFASVPKKQQEAKSATNEKIQKQPLPTQSIQKTTLIVEKNNLSDSLVQQIINKKPTEGSSISTEAIQNSLQPNIKEKNIGNSNGFMLNANMNTFNQQPKQMFGGPNKFQQQNEGFNQAQKTFQPSAKSTNFSANSSNMKSFQTVAENNPMPFNNTAGLGFNMGMNANSLFKDNTNNANIPSMNTIPFNNMPGNVFANTFSQVQNKSSFNSLLSYNNNPINAFNMPNQTSEISQGLIGASSFNNMNLNDQQRLMKNRK